MVNDLYNATTTSDAPCQQIVVTSPNTEEANQSSDFAQIADHLDLKECFRDRLLDTHTFWNDYACCIQAAPTLEAMGAEISRQKDIFKEQEKTILIAPICTLTKDPLQEDLNIVLNPGRDWSNITLDKTATHYAYCLKIPEDHRNKDLEKTTTVDIGGKQQSAIEFGLFPREFADEPTQKRFLEALKNNQQVPLQFVRSFLLPKYFPAPDASHYNVSSDDKMAWPDSDSDYASQRHTIRQNFAEYAAYQFENKILLAYPITKDIQYKGKRIQAGTKCVLEVKPLRCYEAKDKSLITEPCITYVPPNYAKTVANMCIPYIFAGYSPIATRNCPRIYAQLENWITVRTPA